MRKRVAQPAARHDNVVVCSGHMIDAPDRPEPRFPQELEEAVRDARAPRARGCRGRAGHARDLRRRAGRRHPLRRARASSWARICACCWLFRSPSCVAQSVRLPGDAGRWEERFHRLLEHAEVAVQSERLGDPPTGNGRLLAHQPVDPRHGSGGGGRRRVLHDPGLGREADRRRAGRDLRLRGEGRAAEQPIRDRESDQTGGVANDGGRQARETGPAQAARSRRRRHPRAHHDRGARRDRAPAPGRVRGRRRLRARGLLRLHRRHEHRRGHRDVPLGRDVRRPDPRVLRRERRGHVRQVAPARPLPLTSTRTTASPRGCGRSSARRRRSGASSCGRCC